jgi:hypothetical protein
MRIPSSIFPVHVEIAQLDLSPGDRAIKDSFRGTEQRTEKWIKTPDL